MFVLHYVEQAIVTDDEQTKLSTLYLAERPTIDKKDRPATEESKQF